MATAAWSGPGGAVRLGGAGLAWSPWATQATKGALMRSHNFQKPFINGVTPMGIAQAMDETGRQYVDQVDGYDRERRFYVDSLRAEDMKTLMRVAAQLQATRDHMERNWREGHKDRPLSEAKREWLGRLGGAIKWFNIAVAKFDRELRRRDMEIERENERCLKRKLKGFWKEHQERMAAEYVPPEPTPQPTEVEPPKVSRFVQPSITRMRQGMEQLREQRDLMLRRINNLEKKLENLKKQKAGAGEAALQRKYDVLLDLLADEFGEAVADGFDLEAANKATAGAVAVAA